MLIGASLLLFLAADDRSAAVPEPKVRLICQDEIGPLLSRRRLCLTQAEWEERARRQDEAARRSIYELMGNTACLKGGLCTSD